MIVAAPNIGPYTRCFKIVWRSVEHFPEASRKLISMSYWADQGHSPKLRVNTDVGELAASPLLLTSWKWVHCLSKGIGLLFAKKRGQSNKLGSFGVGSVYVCLTRDWTSLNLKRTNTESVQNCTLILCFQQ